MNNEVHQPLYGNLTIYNEEKDIIEITQKQRFGEYNVIQIERENIDELIRILKDITFDEPAA